MQAIREHLATIHDLQAAAAVLEWDLETYMPPGGAEARIAQIATLRRLAHEAFTSAQTAALLDEASGAADNDSLASDLLRVVRRDYDRERRLPTALVAALARASAEARLVWKDAREARRYALFQPHLAEVVRLSREKAEALGAAGAPPYDALLDAYEPGATTAQLAPLFHALRQALVPLLAAIAEKPPARTACLRGVWPFQEQWSFGLKVAQDFGYDLTRGRQDASAHPFTTSFSPGDVRITTRVDEAFFPTAFFGTLHETGHALYEQGFAPELRRTPLAEASSLGMHESQSRLWENLIGRSRPFWEHYFPHLQRQFGAALGGVSAEAWYEAVNAVAPSLIRVEADEVTYNLHVCLRFELEAALVSGELPPADLPGAWNEKMRAYLGLTPADDAEGVLQDIHWSLGLFGYFPTYTLGNLLSVQLFEAARAELGAAWERLPFGEYGELLGWLRRNVHVYGRRLDTDALVRRATGEPLRAEPWLHYIRQKYAALYDLPQ